MKTKELIQATRNISFPQAVALLCEKAKTRRAKTFVVTINPEIIMLARSDLAYEKVLKSADLILPDGIGVVWAAKMFGIPLKDRINGQDLIEKLCKKISEEGLSVGFFGGGQGVAKQTSDNLKKKYPTLKVSFAVEEWENGLSCDVLFVALGSPKQEIWIAQNLSKINVNVAIGVGGSFDFISGHVRRAPVFLRKLGLEWLFRLIIQPWRVKRQLKLLLFVFEVIKERF